MFKRIKQSKAGRIAIWSCLSFGSAALVALGSIPLAVRYLPPGQIGIWVIINQIAIYLAWLDLGIGDGISRKIAPAIAAGDRHEAGSWWSAGWIVLLVQGFLLMALAVGISPLLLDWLDPSHRERELARQLFLLMVAVVALNLPSRIYPGILLAQERYHWVPLVQTCLPWIQIGTFWLLLARGWGVFAFPWAMAASQAAGFLAFLVLVHSGSPHRPGLRLQRGFWPKVGGLIGFGGSMSLHGLVNSVLNSLPTFLIGRWGGLAEVPVYGFTQRGPALLSNLSLRAGVAFFPGMQRMFVEGRLEEFRLRYEQVLALVVAAGMIGAGLVAGFNRSLVETLAGQAYNAGPWTCAWLALGVLLAPFAASVVNLLHFSGSAGWLAFWSVSQLVLAALLGPWMFRSAGMAGLAAMVVLLPMITTVPYSLWRGSRACGLALRGWLRPFACRLGFAVVVVLGGTAILDSSNRLGPVIVIRGQTCHLPGAIELGIALGLLVPGLLLAWRSVGPMLAGPAARATASG